MQRNAKLNDQGSVSFNITPNEMVHLISNYRGGNVLEYSLFQYFDTSKKSMILRISCAQNSNTHKILGFTLFREKINPIGTFPKIMNEILFNS